MDSPEIIQPFVGMAIWIAILYFLFRLKRTKEKEQKYMVVLNGIKQMLSEESDISFEQDICLLFWLQVNRYQRTINRLNFDMVEKFICLLFAGYLISVSKDPLTYSLAFLAFFILIILDLLSANRITKRVTTLENAILSGFQTKFINKDINVLSSDIVSH